jgi:hypothetical protein
MSGDDSFLNQPRVGKRKGEGKGKTEKNRYLVGSGRRLICRGAHAYDDNPDTDPREQLNRKNNYKKVRS